ncbi:MAG: hypothetical protein JO291_08260 [Acidimicrobiia bacterium]|nr:hypothetical protein [Acidimicrobiia bacterium]
MGNWSRRIGPVVAVVAMSLVGWSSPVHASGRPVPLDDGSVAPKGAFDPSVASNGTNSLVVWQKRSGEGNKGDIYGRLVSSDNSSTVTAATRISLTAANDFLPDVAWSGSSWLVVWEQGVSTAHTQILGQRVSKAGALVGSVIAIATGTGYNENPAVTAGPNGQFFVVWEDDRNLSTTDGDIYGRRVSSSGGLMDATNVRLSDDTTDFATADDVLPDVAWNGTAFVAVWEADYVNGSSSEIWADAWIPGQFSTPLLGVIGTSGDYPSTEPSIASAGKTLLVVYTSEASNSIDEDIHATRIDASNETNWPFSGFVVARATGTQDEPTVAYNGLFLAMWQDRRNGTGDLGLARIRTDGTVLDTNGIVDITNDGENLNPALTNGTKTARTYTLAFQSTDPNMNGIDSYAVSTGAK